LKKLEEVGVYSKYIYLSIAAAITGRFK